MTTLPEFPGCFVCGNQNPRGLKIPFSVENRGVRAVFTPDHTLAGYEGTVHGGIVCAMLDEAVIWAAYAALKRFGVTAELNIRFRKPLPVGTECIIRGRLLEDRGRIGVFESEITDAAGAVFAVATGKVVPMKGNFDELH